MRDQSDANHSTSVLIVEDDPAVRDSLSMLLGVNDIKAVTAENAQSALDKLSNGGRPGLVITDYQLPDMTGAEFLKSARRQMGYEVPAIVLTAAPVVAMAAVADLQAVEVIRKPADTRYLTERISRFINKPER